MGLTRSSIFPPGCAEVVEFLIGVGAEIEVSEGAIYCLPVILEQC